MPKTVPLGQSFKYLRDQAAKAVPMGGATPNEGVPVPPLGFQLLKGADGLYLRGADSAYLYGVAV